MRQNGTIYVKWPGADYNFLLWQIGWSGPQYVVAIQCYCLRGCYSARCVPFQSRGDRIWTQIFYVFAHIEHLWLYIKLLDESLLPISLMRGNSFNLVSGIVQLCARSTLIWNLRCGQLIFMADIPVWKTKINRGSSLRQILDLAQMENLCRQSTCCWIDCEFTLPKVVRQNQGLSDISEVEATVGLGIFVLVALNYQCGFSSKHILKAYFHIG